VHEGKFYKSGVLPLEKTSPFFLAKNIEFIELQSADQKKDCIFVLMNYLHALKLNMIF